MMVPNACSRRFWGDLGGVVYKNHEPPGVSARRRRKFLEDLGGVVHKNHVTEVHSGTCFRRKTPPKSSKISACGGRLGTEKSHRFSLRAPVTPGDPPHPPRGEVSMSLGNVGPKLRFHKIAVPEAVWSNSASCRLKFWRISGVVCDRNTFQSAL